jgi:hypothetical protein
LAIVVIPIPKTLDSHFFYYCYYYYHLFFLLSEGSLEVKLPTIWTDEKAEVGRVREAKSRTEKLREEKE